jgi:putative toxin-antitoxin system antitoxin component (TIGR02293 family)
LEAYSPVMLISRIEHGLPVDAIEKVARLIAPNGAQFKYRLVPKATLERRKTTNRLSPEEGTRLARLARVWSAARDLWGSDEEARDFLFRPHPMAEDNRPIELAIGSEFGAELILDINNSGHSVGYSQTPSGGYDAVLWSASRKASVLPDADGGDTSEALAINASGQSVGYSSTASGSDFPPAPRVI